MASVDSYNGARNTGQSSFLTWWASNSFGGANYSNTPLGAVTHVAEPETGVENTYTYYGTWAVGKPFVFNAWYALYSNQGGYQECAVVGDPFVTK